MTYASAVAGVIDRDQEEWVGKRENEEKEEDEDGEDWKEERQEPGRKYCKR